MRDNCFSCKNLKTACGEYYCVHNFKDVCEKCGRILYDDDYSCFEEDE